MLTLKKCNIYEHFLPWYSYERENEMVQKIFTQRKRYFECYIERLSVKMTKNKNDNIHKNEVQDIR